MAYNQDIPIQLVAWDISPTIEYQMQNFESLQDYLEVATQGSSYENP